MAYEWDGNKVATNLSKHGVSFEEAKTFFDDPLHVDFHDPDHSYGEHRFILLGRLKATKSLSSPTRAANQWGTTWRRWA